MTTFKLHVSFLIPIVRPANYARFPICELAIVSLEITLDISTAEGYCVRKKTKQKIYDGLL